MKKIIILVLALLLLYPSTIAFTEQEEEIKLYMEHPKILSVSVPQKIIIADPKILDVTSVSEDSLTLVPKGVGLTTFSLVDSLGEQSYFVRVLLEDVTDAKIRIDNLLKELNLIKVYTKLAETESKVLLLGRVKSSEEKDRLNIALGPLKEKTADLIEIKEEEAVVDIEVQVLELSKGSDKTLGLTWPTGSSGVTTFTETGSPGISTSGVAWSSLGSLFKVASITRSPAFSLTLSMLLKEGKARILSQPRLTCQSGKEAELLVGGEKPILTTTVAATTGTAGTNVDYKEYGIKLKIKPVVTSDNRIKLALNIEVSEVGAEVTIGGANTTALAYPLTKRNASTEVFLDNGQTMAIGGLFKQKNTETIEKVPWLADVPILGILFRKRTTQLGDGSSTRGDTELFITITPTILASAKGQAEEVPVSQKEEVVPAGNKPLAAEEDVPEELKDYIKSVQLKIINAAYYPQEAKELGWEGTVGLMLRLAPNGDLKEARVTQSSGYKSLDDAALEIVQKQSPYPVFPQQVKLEELRIKVPVVYRKN